MMLRKCTFSAVARTSLFAACSAPTAAAFGASRADRLPPSLPACAHVTTTLITSRRCYFQVSRSCLSDTAQQTQPPGSASAAPSSGTAANESALDVAMRVNKLKKQHQSGNAGAQKKEVEQEAWQALNSLSEDQINNAEGKAVSLLLNSWAYFAKFWAKGKDGPL